MELNPNHPVTKAASDYWHTIVGVLLHTYRHALPTDVVLTVSDIEAFQQRYPHSTAAVVIHQKEDGVHLRIVSMEEGERLAREAGGLPT